MHNNATGCVILIYTRSQGISLALGYENNPGIGRHALASDWLLVNLCFFSQTISTIFVALLVDTLPEIWDKMAEIIQNTIQYGNQIGLKNI